MNPINEQNQQSPKQNKNLTPVLVAAGIFIFIILISLLGIYFLTRQKAPTGQKPIEITEVGAGRVNGPEVSIKKQGDAYIVDAQMPIVIQTNEEGINFKNDTDLTIGVFVPALQEGNNLKIMSGSTEGFSLRALRRDSMVCVGNDKCNQFEFLGSVYPALFKGTIEIVSANTVTNTPTPTAVPSLSPTITSLPNQNPTTLLTQTINPTIAISTSPTLMHFLMSPPSTFTPNANGYGDAFVTKHSDGYWDITLSNISVARLEPNRNYQFWVCGSNCASVENGKFTTNENGEAYVTTLTIRNNQNNNPLNRLVVYEIPPQGQEIPNDPTACFMISNTSPACLLSNDVQT